MQRKEVLNMYTDNWTELYHHGIKGQKHGKRRYQNPDGSLTPLGREHYGVGVRRAKTVAGAGTAVAGAGLVNAGLLAAKRASTANAAKYYSKATTQAEFASSWKNAGLSFARQEAKNYTEQLLALPALSSPAVVAPIAIGGAAALAGLGYIGYKKYQQYKANKGTSVKHCDLSEFDEDTLCHFGIPGQKWGKRRYQNPDGSLTPEGYIRYYGHAKGKQLLDYKDLGYEADPDLGGDYTIKKTGPNDNTEIRIRIPEDTSKESKQRAIENAKKAEKDIEDIRNTSVAFKEHDLGAYGTPRFSNDEEYDLVKAKADSNGKNRYARSVYDDYDGEYLGDFEMVKLNNKWTVKDLLSDNDKKLAVAETSDTYDLDFLETIQSDYREAPDAPNTKSAQTWRLNEYKKYLNDPYKYMSTFEAKYHK